MFDPASDQEGLAKALDEIFEEDFRRSEIDRQLVNASTETRARLLAALPPRSLSPGYYRFALHLMHLDAQRNAGVGFSARDLVAAELGGLVTLMRARGEFEGRHPKCSACGLRQQGRFGVECGGCGVKFRRKGSK